MQATVSWPAAGLGGKGDEGVAGIVKRTPYSIGYIDARFAKENRMDVSAIRNRSGRFVQPNIQSLTAAAKGGTLPNDFRGSIANGADRGAYPIAALTWLLVPEHIPDHHKRRAVVAFVEWMLARGTADLTAQGFAPLPKELVAREQAQIGLIH